MKCENVEIYFELSRNQRRKLDSYGYCHVLLETIPMNIFKRVTKNKKLIDRFVKYKQSFLREVENV